MLRTKWSKRLGHQPQFFVCCTAAFPLLPQLWEVMKKILVLTRNRSTKECAVIE